MGRFLVVPGRLAMSPGSVLAADHIAATASASASAERSADSTDEVQRVDAEAVQQVGVLLDASDGHGTWGSIGVSENVIEASWEALVDSLELAMQPSRIVPQP